MRPFLIVALLVTALVAGCTDAPDDGDDETDMGTGSTDGNNTTAAPQVFEGTGTATASTSVGGFGAGGLDFTVDEGATLLHAELSWDDEVSDLDLALASPSSGSDDTATNYDERATGGSPGAPDSPHALTLSSPEAGAWQGGALANGAAAGVEYTIVATVFYGATEVPEGYTALS